MHGMLPSFVGDKVTHVAKPLEFWCNLSNSKILMGIEVSDDCAGQSGAVLEDVTMLGHDVEEPNRVCEIKPKKERWKSLAMDAKLDNGGLEIPLQLEKRTLADETQLQSVKTKKDFHATIDDRTNLIGQLGRGFHFESCWANLEECHDIV
ncbi:hypothetical protein ACOSP7_007016 [Xanthoceras sorbifolium]